MNRRRFLAAGSATAATLFAAAHLRAQAQSSLGPSSRNSAGAKPLLFGVDYYPEQTPENLWEKDAAAMAAAGITNVRIAEFAWALMEPKEGHFEFTWLDRVIGILHAHGLAVILGTPSAAPPNWLTQKYPEVLLVNDHGMTLSPGARRFTCPSNVSYRRLSVAIASGMARRFASTPGVIGWQIDNELTLGESARCYCKSCREGFQQWLRTRYQTLDVLNEAWGAVVWSNTYTDFSQVPVPLPSGAPPNPGLVLDYDRYQSTSNAVFLDQQLQVLRSECPNHFVTTNNVGGLIDNLNLRELYRGLDFVSVDNYPGFFSLFLSGSDAGPPVPAEALAAMISFSLDFARGIQDGKPFLIMEQQSGKAGQQFFSAQPEPGQLRLWSYQAVAHGAMGINYFRWDTPTFGAEEYWHGLLQFDRSPSPGFDEIQRAIRELKSLGPEALHAPCEAAIGLCFDSNADWALTIQPGNSKLKYFAEMLPWYGALAASYAGVDIVDATGDLSSYKLVCAPLMYIVTQQQAERIRAFVQAGGVFIAGLRLGVKDEHSRIVNTPPPGLLRDVMGVELTDYQPLGSQKQTVKFAEQLTGAEAICQTWADILNPKTASVLATYATGQYAGKAAITANKFGKGQAFYIGAHLEPADLARVLLTLAATGGVKASMQLPAGVESSTRHAAGRSWTYLLNHTAKAQSVSLAANYRDAFSSSTVSGSLTLEPYGVRVLTPG